LITTVAAAAYGRSEWVTSTVVIAVLGLIAGALWFVVEHRRVRLIDTQRHAAHHDGVPR